MGSKYTATALVQPIRTPTCMSLHQSVRMGTASICSYFCVHDRMCACALFIPVHKPVEGLNIHLQGSGSGPSKGARLVIVMTGIFVTSPIRHGDVT